MKNNEINNFIKERIEENKSLFIEEEIQLLKNNQECMKKIYILGFINARNCYKK